MTKHVKNDQGKEKSDDCPPPKAEVINMIIGGQRHVEIQIQLGRAIPILLGILSSEKGKIQLEYHFLCRRLNCLASPHDDIFWSSVIANFDIKRVLVDGSSA